MNTTKELKLTLKANNPLTLHSFIDASYTVHSDGKSRTGNVVTLGEGQYSSTKRNFVTKSSTEAEIVGVFDGLGANLGLMYVMQGTILNL